MAVNTHDLDRFSLADLVRPLSVPHFLTQHYGPSRPFWTGDAGPPAGRIGDLPDLRVATRILGRYRGRVSALRPDGTAVDLSGGREAVTAYTEGYTCYLRRVDEQIPQLRGLAHRISTDLGVPPAYLVCELFCSDGPSGVAMHSDYDINLALLVRGEKHWQIARNEHLVNPPGICLAGASQPDPVVHRLTESLDLPTAMPAEAHQVTMRSGGLLFVPRGWWHQTSASGECLQLNFVVKGPQFATLAADAIAQALVMDPAWREFAHGLGGTPAQREMAVSRLSSLIREARSVLESNDNDRDLAIEILRRANLWEPETPTVDRTRRRGHNSGVPMDDESDSREGDLWS